MAQQTTVDLAGMQRAESAFATAISNANTQADRVDNVSNNLNSQWKGQAASLYNGALGEWMTHFMACRKALTEMHQKLQQTTNQYTTTNTETIDGANQAKSAMAGLPNFPI
jgi:WXG100 family type VII secretion target